MDKKNTMLLTVIAVATLLVAVVGATFAFFSLSITGEQSTTNATVETTHPGSIAITGTDQQLLVKVGAVEMAKDNPNKYYWALNGQSDVESVATAYNTSNYTETVTSNDKFTIATAALTGGTSGVNYECKYNVTITSVGTLKDLSAIAKDDLVLYVYGDGIETEEFQLNTLKEANNYTDHLDGTFTLNGPSGNSNVQVALRLRNSGTDQTTQLAEKDIKVSIAITAPDPCTLKEAS